MYVLRPSRNVMSAVARTIATIAFVSLFVLLLALSFAPAAECPPGVAKCKVLTLTPEEEQVLVGPGFILDIAERGAQVQLGGTVKYFREKILNAPPGTVKPVEPPKQ